MDEYCVSFEDMEENSLESTLIFNVTIKYKKILEIQKFNRKTINTITRRNRG